MRTEGGRAYQGLQTLTRVKSLLSTPLREMQVVIGNGGLPSKPLKEDDSEFT